MVVNWLNISKFVCFIHVLPCSICFFLFCFVLLCFPIQSYLQQVRYSAKYLCFTHANNVTTDIPIAVRFERWPASTYIFVKYEWDVGVDGVS